MFETFLSAMVHVNVNGRAYNFGMVGGQLSIDGTPVQLSDSTSRQYSAAKGWQMFTYNGIMFFYSSASQQLVPVPPSKSLMC